MRKIGPRVNAGRLGIELALAHRVAHRGAARLVLERRWIGDREAWAGDGIRAERDHLVEHRADASSSRMRSVRLLLHAVADDLRRERLRAVIVARRLRIDRLDREAGRLQVARLHAAVLQRGRACGSSPRCWRESASRGGRRLADDAKRDQRHVGRPRTIPSPVTERSRSRGSVRRLRIGRCSGQRQCERRGEKKAPNLVSCRVSSFIRSRARSGAGIAAFARFAGCRGQRAVIP